MSSKAQRYVAVRTTPGIAPTKPQRPTSHGSSNRCVERYERSKVAKIGSQKTRLLYIDLEAGGDALKATWYPSELGPGVVWYQYGIEPPFPEQ